MAKNERTVYRALSTQEQVAADATAASVPIIDLVSDGDCAEDDAAAALRCWAEQRLEEQDGLLDLRNEVAYDAGHVVGATSLPWGDEGEILVARAHELPPRGATLALLAQQPKMLQAAATHLVKSGYRLSFCISVPETPALWAGALAAAGLQFSAPGDRSSRRLWRASPCLEACLPLVESRLIAAGGCTTKTTVDPRLQPTTEPEPDPEPNRSHVDEGNQVLPERRGRVALDLGCGSGRDCVWLAQQLCEEGWSVLGIDHLPKMLQRYELLATHARPPVTWSGSSVDSGASVATSWASSSGGCCAALQSNVEHWCSPAEKDGSQRSGFASTCSHVSLIHISHYLHRPLLGWIRDHSSLVAVGGSVVCATTMHQVAATQISASIDKGPCVTRVHAGGTHFYARLRAHRSADEAKVSLRGRRTARAV